MGLMLFCRCLKVIIYNSSEIPYIESNFPNHPIPLGSVFYSVLVKKMCPFEYRYIYYVFSINKLFFLCSFLNFYCNIWRAKD